MVFIQVLVMLHLTYKSWLPTGHTITGEMEMDADPIGDLSLTLDTRDRRDPETLGLDLFDLRKKYESPNMSDLYDTFFDTNSPNYLRGLVS